MLSPQAKKKKVISRRSFMLSAAKLAALTVLGGRLYYLQINQGAKYSDLADGNRINMIPVMPRRGIIRDRNGYGLAEGIPRYQLLFNPPKSLSAKENFLELAKLINLPKAKIDAVLEKISDKSTKYPILIENFMEWQDIAKIKIKNRDFKSANIRFREARVYPFSEVMAHVIGYTGKVSDISAKSDGKYAKLLTHPDFRVGKVGIELERQDELLGEPGIVEVEVDAKGRLIKEVSYKSHTIGKNIDLSIDIEIQTYLTQLLKGKGGKLSEGASSVIMDIQTGEILAMANVPSYDPNSFIRGISNEELEILYNNPDTPLINRAINVTYPPGSTMKPMVALAALQEGVISTASQVQCAGGVQFGDRVFKCWKEGGHGVVDMNKAIYQSCNVYFYELARILGVDKIAEYARYFGLGQVTGIELPYEESGIIPDPKWKKEVLGQSWFEGETLNTAIGQGYVSATPLQLAVVAARLASGGKKIEPTIIKRNKDDNINFQFIREISGRNMQYVQQAMGKTVNYYQGTVYGSRIDISNYRFAGKTGTAQTTPVKIKKKKKSFEETHALFIGYAPILQPRFAISVVVEYGGGGSAAAAPIARDALLFTQRRMSV